MLLLYLLVVLFANSLARDNSCNYYDYTPKIRLIEKGSLYTTSYSIYFQDEYGPISPFHDIPLFSNATEKIYNMIVEIPRGTNAKMEIIRNSALNPIKQDIKNEELRFVTNTFPFRGYLWNYGALPQTWENPNSIDSSTGQGGDNDPIDVIEIGSRDAKMGDVLQVKILGSLALIDEGETDWKLIAIDAHDSLASQLNSIEDIKTLMPGMIETAIYWLKTYKVSAGKPLNIIGLGEVPQDSDFTHAVIEETHDQWKDLISGRVDPGKIDIRSARCPCASMWISKMDAYEIISEAADLSSPASRDPSLDKWFFLDPQLNAAVCVEKNK